MARFLVKASEFKNVCKAVNDRKLAELKKEIIEILKKQDEKEFKKAIDYLESQEDYFTHYEKSLSGKWVEKAGYGVGTIRVWKGKKYKKIAPGKWARVFDKEGRGTNIAIGRLIAKVQKIDNVEDLMAFVMANKQRFVDENGIDLPVLDKLRAAVDAKNNGNVGSKGTSKPIEKESEEEKQKLLKERIYRLREIEWHRDDLRSLETALARAERALKMFKDGTADWDIKRVYKDERKTKELLQDIKDSIKKEEDWLKENPFEKEEKSAEKKKSFKQEMNQLYDAQDEAWEGFESGSDIKSSPENSKKFYERVKKFVDDNKIKLSQKHYDEIEEMNGHSFNEALELAGAYGEEKKEKALAKNREYSKKYKGQILDLSMIDEFKEKEDMENPYEMTEAEKKEAMKDPKTRLSQKYDLVINTKKGTPENNKAIEDYLNERNEVKRELGIDAVKNFPIVPKAEETKIYWIQDSRGNRLTNEDAKQRLMADIENLKTYHNEYLLDRLNPEDRKEIESEYEKIQNRSDAMKGNKNAYKGGVKETPKKSLSEKKADAERMSKNHQTAVEKVIKDIKDKLGSEKSDRGLEYLDSYTNGYKYQGGQLGQIYSYMMDEVTKVKDRYGEIQNDLNESIKDSGSKDLDEYISTLQNHFDEMINERKSQGVYGTKHSYWSEVFKNGIELQALKDIRDNGLQLTENEVLGKEEEVKDESAKQREETKRINTINDYFEEESETNPYLDKKTLAKIYDAIKNGEDTSKFNQRDVQGIADFMGVELKNLYAEKKVRKSLFDGFLGLGLIEEDIEDEEEESLWNDYSAEPPELFNSVEFKVREALNRRYCNCL